MNTISSIMSQRELTISRVESFLGRPHIRGEGFAFYCADCLPTLRRLPTEAIALTVTSPPYNIGKEYETPLELDRYLSWCEQWLNEIHRVTCPDGAFCLNLGYVGVPGRGKAVPLPYLLWARCKFFLMQEVVWNYGAGVAARRSLSPRNEKILWYVKDAGNYTFNLDAIRDPDVKYPRQKKERQAAVQHDREEPVRCVADRQGHFGRKPCVPGAHGASGSVPSGPGRSNGVRLLESG